MNSIFKVYTKLKREYEEENIVYDEEENIISAEKYSIKASEKDGEISVDMEFEKQNFHLPIITYGLLYEFISGIFGDKIKITRTTPRDIEITEWCSRYSEKEYGRKLKIRRFISSIIGIIAVVFAIILFRAFGSYYMHNSYKYDMNDIAVLIFLGGVLIAGISGIHHALVKKPVSTARAIGFFVGMLLVSFGISTLVLTLFGKKLNDTNTFSGIVLFTFSALTGVGFIIISLFKKHSGDKFTLTRTLELPVEEERLAIIEKLKEKLTEKVIFINKNEETPKLTGSKFGGVPYWDSEKEYPLDSTGNPLMLYLQINLTELPENEVFEKTGLLQFFVNNNSDFCECAVEYHSKIKENLSEEVILEVINKDGKKYQKIDECAISFESGEMVNISNADRVNETMHKTAEELEIILDKTFVYEELFTNEEYMELTVNTDRSCLLGFAGIHLDNYEEIGKDYNRILLSIVSDDSDLNDYEHFCINEQKLYQKDYSDVKYFCEMV